MLWGKVKQGRGHLKQAAGGGNSQAVQWLGLCAPTANGMGSISGQTTEILQPCSMAEKKKKVIIFGTLK